MHHFTGNIPWTPEQTLRGIGNAAPSHDLSDEEAGELIRQAVGSVVDDMGRKLDQIAKVDEQQRRDIAMLQKQRGVTVNSQAADDYDTLPD